jgi:hypothetical protein
MAQQQQQHRPHPSDAAPAADRTTVVLPEALKPGRLGLYDRPVDVPAHLAAQAAQLNELRGEAERLRAECDRLLERQRQIAELLHSPNPEKIVHDLRNVLNELQLYKLLADTEA